VDGRDKPGHNDGTAASAVVTRRTKYAHLPKFFFIIFVDAIFTTLFERLFTNVFDVTSANAAISWLCRACNAD
jgi:hypothetical protein